MIDMNNPLEMAVQIARLRDAVNILVLELDAAYNGLRTLPEDHSAKKAVGAAMAVLNG